jgi:serine/threonine protein kinase
LKGGSLIERIQWLEKSRKCLSLDNIREIMIGIVRGLIKLNEVGVVHRDIKLENVVLRDMYSFEPVIIDFGLATFIDESEYIYYRCGTAGFVSP